MSMAAIGGAGSGSMAAAKSRRFQLTAPGAEHGFGGASGVGLSGGRGRSLEY